MNTLRKTLRIALTLLVLLTVGASWYSVFAVVNRPSITQTGPVVPTPDPLADEPSAVVSIEYPASVIVGDLIEIDATQSEGLTFAWLLPPEYEKHYRIIDAGKRVLISAKQVGTIRVVVGATINDSISMKEFNIEVKPTEVVQPVKPKPVGLEADMKAALSSINVANKLAVQTELSTAFTSVANLVDSGILKDPAEVVEATGKLTQKATGGDASWRPVLEIVEQECSKRSKADQLKTAAQHAELWRDLAKYLSP